MQLFHHIVFSRALAMVVFAMFLVLTPRAWVEAENGVTEEVPVNVLEAPSDCLWCDPLPAEPCSDSPEDHAKRPMWLNPDQAVGPVEMPCYVSDTPTPES